MTYPPSRLAELEEAAKAATPGPYSETGGPQISAGKRRVCKVDIAFKDSAQYAADKKYLALANPAEILALIAYVRVVVAERDNLRMQAESWAMEARAHKSSLHEAYQHITGATGEPGNWNGARPIVEAFDAANIRAEAAEQQRDVLVKALRELRKRLVKFDISLETVDEALRAATLQQEGGA